MSDLVTRNSTFSTVRLLPDEALGEITWPRQVSDNLGWIYSEPRTLVSAALHLPAIGALAPTRYFHFWVCASEVTSRSVPGAVFCNVRAIGSFYISFNGTRIFTYEGGHTDYANASSIFEGLDVGDWADICGTWVYKNAATAGTLTFEVTSNYGSSITIYGTAG